MNAKLFLIVAALVLLALALGSSAVAFTPEGPGTLSITAGSGENLAVQAYWTADRIAAARPVNEPTIASTAAEAEVGAQDLGEPGSAPGGLPNPRANAEAIRALPEVWGLDAEAAETVGDLDVLSLEPTGTSGIYTSYYGNKFTQFWKTFPYKAVGKLYFSDWLGNNYYCSASVISPNNIIVTAGHCLYDTDVNRWYTNWLFVPAERNYAAPYGTFSWSVGWILGNYMNAPNWASGIR